MPHEYECRSRKERFEVLQKIGESNEELCCPKCSADNPEKSFLHFVLETPKE